MTGIIVSNPPTVELPPGSTTGGSAVLPGVTYTYALLGLPQTWTAKQTFPLGNITLQAADVVGLSSSVAIDTSQIVSGVLPLARGGTATGALVSNAFPGPGDPTQGTGIASGALCAPLNMNVVYSGSGVYPFQIASTNPYAIGYAGNSISAVTAGLTYGVIITHASIAGSPITVTVTAADTVVNNVVTALRAAIQADSRLYNSTTGLPLFCQGGTGSGLATGVFNIQFDATYAGLTVAKTGTGNATMTMATVNRTLDYAVTILGRRIVGYTGQAGDSIHVLQFEGQSTSGAMDAVGAQIGMTLTNATAGSVTSKLKFTSSVASVLTDVFHIADGMFLYRPLSPATNGGTALGTTALQWSNLYLASSGTINFNNGDIIISHAVATGGQLAFSGAASGYQFDAPVYPAGDGSAALGQLTLGWSNVFLSSGGTIGFNNNNWVATHSSGILTVGTGTLKITAPTNTTTSVVTIDGTQTLTNKTISGASNTLSVRIANDVTGLGNSVATALGVNVGTAGAFVVNGGALGSPSSVGTLPAFTLGGTVSGGGNAINNVNIGAISPGTGAFSNINTTGTLVVTGNSQQGLGGTGTTPANIDYYGSSGAAGGVNTRWLKNAALKWQHGFLNTMLGSGTSDDMTFYRNGSSVFALTMSFTDDSVAFGSATDSTSSTTGGITTAGGAGIAKALFVGTTANVAGVATLASGTATPAGGSTSARALLGTTAGFGIYYGSGAPTVSAAAGSLYIRTDNAGANLRLYSNTTGSTTWAAITSA